GNYGNTSGSITDTIGKATVTCDIKNYNVKYDGQSHTATGTCTNAAGTVLNGLDLNGTVHTVPGNYSGDKWSFTDNTGNYGDTSGTVDDVITKADPNCTVNPYNVTYDGASHTAKGSCTGVGGVDITSGLNLGGTTHTDPGPGANGAWADTWNFADSSGIYNTASGPVTDVIAKAKPTCSVPGYTVPYDGAAHTSTGTCTGIGGVSLSGLDLGSTTHTNAGAYTDPWTFTDASGDYLDQNGSVSDNITKVQPTCTVTPYNVKYDGNSHTATGSCTGVGGADISSGLVLTNTTHINAGTFSDTWSFSDSSGNYYALGTTTIQDIITKVDATCTVTGYTVPYDGIAHTATGSCIGVKGETLNTLNLNNTTHTVAGKYTDPWSFTDANNNYNSQNGTVDDTINGGTAACVVTAYNVTYDGVSHTATGVCTSPTGTILNGLDLSGTTHANAGSYTDTWTFTDNTGAYSNLSGTVTDVIAQANATCTVTGYTVIYNGAAHTATGACTGVGGINLSSDLNLSGTTHTAIGNYTDTWNFTEPSGNYKNQTGTVTDNITSNTPTCTVTPYNVTYDGAAHTASGSCVAPNGVTLSGLVLTDTTHINAGTFTDTWTFTDSSGVYGTLTGSVTDIIAQAAVRCTVTGYSVTYNAAAHTATGTCTGLGGTNLTAGLNLTGTTHTDAGTYATDTWTFTDANGNYANATGTVADAINPAEATCKVSGYNVTYDGAAHVATGSCAGIGGVDVSGLDLSKTSHTGAGDFPADPWKLTNNNYTATGTVHDVINQITATCTVTGFSGQYSGASHGAKGSCISASGATMPGLDLGSLYTNAGVYTVTWTFTNPNVSNSPQSGTVTVTITKADTTVKVTCPANATYTGNPLEPCTANVIGGGLNQALTVSYTNNTEIGTASASAAYAGDVNHNGNNGSANFDIISPTLAGVPLVGNDNSGPVAANQKGEIGTGLDTKAGPTSTEFASGLPTPTIQPTSTKAVVQSGLDGKAQAQNSSKNSTKNTGKSGSSTFWKTYSGLFGCIGTVFLAFLIFFMFRRRNSDDSENSDNSNGGSA
ncbi:MAG TPA: hypothetical protein VMT91_00545, partial [Anaerolineales bacterium]|nr:hypothetical protein [Anaerolineales bacterium]